MNTVSWVWENLTDNIKLLDLWTTDITYIPQKYVIVFNIHMHIYKFLSENDIECIKIQMSGTT